MRLANPFLHCIDILYSFFTKIGNNLQSIFLLYMRLTWGYQLLKYGWAKLNAIEQTAEFLASLQIASFLPYFNAYLLGWLELLGGISFLLGFAARAMAIPIIFIMLTALFTAHAANVSNFRFLFEPLLLVQQPPYPFLITALLMLLFGPGRISIDAWLKRWAKKQPKY